MRDTRAVFHKVGSIGQNPPGIKRATRTRCTTVLEHLDATTAPIRRRGVVAFRGTEDLYGHQASIRSTYQPFDDLVGSGEHDSFSQVFCVRERSLHLVDSFPEYREVPRGHFELVQLIYCCGICGISKSAGEIVENSLTRLLSRGLRR